MSQTIPTEFVSFIECVNYCLSNQEFLAEYDRLHSTNFTKLNSLNGQIDIATGHIDAQLRTLFDFIRDYIWLPTLETVGEEVREQ